MNNKNKKKLCWNCEGRVGFDQEHCPFCGVYLSPSTAADADIDNEENQNFVNEHLNTDESLQENQSEEIISNEGSQNSCSQTQQILLPLALLLGGTTFFLFGLILYLFSQEGTFTLQWNAHYWYWYLTVSIGMLFTGWRTLHQVDS